MKSTILKKSSAVILAATILFTTVFSLSIFANAATVFSPRLSAPASTNKYYYSDINIFYKYGYGMPNCTAYAYGRAYELLDKAPKLCPYDADEWYDYNINNGYYSYGKTPKLGAIACWAYNGGGGHVAVVEKIENGKITFSNSAYSGTNFYLSYANTSDSNAGGESWWNFQGYIYIGDFTTSSDTTYTAGIYKTNVDDSLNMRSGAGTSYSYVTSVPNGVQLTVTEVKSSDGYHWGYTTYNGKSGWVALEFCEYVSDLPETQPTTVAPTTEQPTTVAPTTEQPTTVEPTTQPSTTVEPTTTVATQETTQPETTKTQALGVGDVNLDGRISILDATLIQKYIAELTVLTDEQISYCDFDFDGRISVMDSTVIQKYLVL